jgi:hypothetical protein
MLLIADVKRTLGRQRASPARLRHRRAGTIERLACALA